MEKHGVPVATVCTNEFFALGKAEAECLGMAGLPIVVVPHPVAKLLPDSVRELAEEALPEIERLLAAESVALQEEQKNKTIAANIKLKYHSVFEGNFNAPDAPDRFKAPDSWDAINTLLYRRGWTDGLPIVPPTPERNEAMLARGWDADDVLGLVEPKLGRATVAKLAANAVMAGCEPEHLPILAAAIRAICEPPLNLKALQTTTHPCTVLTLVNGPYGQEAEINGSYNAMGQGSKGNAVVGRGLRLALINIGGASPGALDRSTAGSPAKYSFCFAENEEDNPWEPLHVERGFDRNQSTVTVCGVEGPHNVNDHYGKSAEEVLLTIAGVIATPGCNNSYLRGEIIVALGPEHAEIIARDGWSKLDARQYLIENARIPSWHINDAQRRLMAEYVPERLIGPDGRDGVAILGKPEEVTMIVAGGAGRHSQVIHSFGNTKSVTVPITDGAGNPL